MATPKNNRSGRYVRQIEGYDAFVPANLPPVPSIKLDDEMNHLLSDADRALGRLDGSVENLPNPELFTYMYVRKEAVLSSQIEGTQASLNNVLEAEAQLFDPMRPRDTAEILNYVDAMNFGLERLAQLPLSLRLMCEIHDRLMRNTRGMNLAPGEFRRSQNWIGPEGCNLRDATFVPPPPSELLNHLGALEKFMHANDRIPLLVRIGLIHAQFETIHPFLDGNGRLGRLLVTFLLCHHGELSKPVLYLSHYLKKNRSDYYRLLQAVRDDGDWESWLKFFVRGIALVAKEASETSRSIVRIREGHRALLLENLGRGAQNGLKLLESLYQRPLVDVRGVKALLGVSQPAANQLSERMVQLGLLQEITGHKRNRMFRYSQYVALFTD